MINIPIAHIALFTRIVAQSIGVTTRTISKLFKHQRNWLHGRQQPIEAQLPYVSWERFALRKVFQRLKSIKRNKSNLLWSMWFITQCQWNSNYYKVKINLSKYVLWMGLHLSRESWPLWLKIYFDICILHAITQTETLG